MTWLDQTRAVLRRDFLTDIRYPLAFAMTLLDLGLLLVSYSFLAGVFGTLRPDGYAPLPFLLIGVALTDSLTTGLVCLAMGVRSTQQTGTVRAVLALPLAPAAFMGMSMVYPVLRSALDFVVFLLIGVALGVRAADVNLAGIVVTFLLAVASVLAMGLVSAAFALVFKRGDPVLWAVGTATWLLSGVLYPTSVLPPWLGVLSAWLPTTHALAAMRAAIIDGAPWTALAPDLTALAVFDLLAIPIALWMFSWAVTVAKRAGTLGHT